MRARRYIAPILRLSGFIAAIAIVLLYVDFRVARASVMERLLGIGKRMAPFLDEARLVEAPRELHVNGLTLFAAAGHTERPPSEVKQWYAERYAGKGSATDVITDELRKLKVVPPTTTGLSQATFGDDNLGGMAALDLGGGVTWRKLGAAVRALAQGRIGDVGHLRYLYCEKTRTGGTRFITIWTDEKFDLSRLLPDASADAPGRDVDDVPRYPGTVRVLSSDERGRAGQLAVYVGPGSPDAAGLFYEARMRTLGWQADARFAKLAAGQGLHSGRWLNGKGHEVVIDLADESGGQGLTVTVVELR